MLKLLGAALVLFACGLAGFGVARGYSRRPLELRGLRAALQMLETEIIYTATPLAEAVERVAARAEPRIAPLFARSGEELRAMSGCSAREAWERGLAAFYPATALKPADLAILRQLGTSLGVSDRQDQSKHLHLAMEQLGLEMNKAAREAERQVKLWNYLGFLGGLAVILLLY
ncbi:stage III sporulation protein SpoIIIAB [Desulfotomaculum copahuensis]|uniref:Stage III sporulation protein AB n=1 Tax=Desulfotomaculum copahuensis TaxID=1838280 RepID=A0A1B7LJ88_9FIRM|nr:stage III sporulation protein SpoIIIAB [Desulfotomaculum copahuensis]OAT86541.1 stage III sporulation protein AB [Desulfotomaculum copahuensis]